MRKALLVDGSFELFRCFHGAPRAQVDGVEVGAVRGLVATLASLLRKEEAVWVAVAFDAIAPPRSAMPAGDAKDLRSQVLPAFDAVRALGIPLWPMRRYQADDALASGAAALFGVPEVEQIVLCTSDKDLLQCVRGTRVICRNRITKVETDEPAFRTRFGVRPDQLPDWFALVGDPSDGLPGVPGWGPRSASAVLAAHERLADIPEDAEDWAVSVRGAKRLAASLKERRIEAQLARDLSVLRDDLPVPCDLQTLEWTGPTPALGPLLERLGDPHLTDWVPDRLARRLQ